MRSRPATFLVSGTCSMDLPGPREKSTPSDKGCAQLGYIEGQSIAVEYRFVSGQVERYAGLAAELVRLKVDVIVAPATPQALAAQQATSSIPIVFVLVADAVGAPRSPGRDSEASVDAAGYHGAGRSVGEAAEGNVRCSGDLP